MKIKEILCKSVLSKSKLADYCVNCYVGCQHACRYCYAAYYTRLYTTHKEEWGSFLDIKVNAPDILKKDVVKTARGSVFFSSLTDPYQPIEKKYELTRKCLEILLSRNFSVCIQTKSTLVLRDLDLLKKFKNCEVGFTITTLDEDVRKIFEPFSSSVEDKVNALRALKEAGIKTFVFFGPILPGLSEINLEEYFKKLSSFTNCFYIDKLNIKPGIWPSIENALKAFRPELLDTWNKVLFKDSRYYFELKEKIRNIVKRNGIKAVFCY